MTLATRTLLRALALGAAALPLSACGGSGGGGGSPPPVDAGETVAVGGLVQPRAGHTATLVSGELILTAGGESLAVAATKSAEVFDLDQGHGRPLLAEMSTPRVGHLAIRLPTGRVWLPGGADDQGRPQRSSDVYDEATRAFAPGPDLGAPRVDAAGLVTASGAIVIAGGRGEASYEVWGADLRPRGGPRPLPGIRVGGTLVELAPGRLYLGGAHDGTGRAAPPLWIDLAAGTVEVEEHGAWVEHGTPVRTATAGEPAAAFVVGGRLDGEPLLGFHPVADGPAPPPRNARLAAQQPGTPPPTPVGHRLAEARLRPSVAATSSGVLVVGGELNGRRSAVVELVDADGSYGVTPLQVPRSEAVLVALPDGRVVVTGGRGNDGLPVGTVELYTRAGERPDTDGIFADARRADAERRRLEAELDRLRRELPRVRGERDRARADLARTRADLAAARQRIADLEAEERRLNRALADANADRAALRARLADARAELAQARSDVRNLRRREAEFQALFATQRDEIAALEREVERLRRELEAARRPPPPPPGGGASVGLFG